MIERVTSEPLEGGTRCSFLLCALLALFVLDPLLGGDHTGAAALDVYVSVTLLLTVRVLRGPRRIIYRAALALAAFAIASAVGSHLFDFAAFLPLGHILGFLFFLVTGFTLLTRALGPGRVTTHRLQAAVCAYLLIGLGWGLVYSVMLHVDPAAFRDPTGGSPESHAVLAGFPHLIYYSFATLTTLGFGDVLPVTPLARSLSTLEAIIGQLYLALLVARLVGLHSASLAADELTDCPAEDGARFEPDELEPPSPPARA